MPKAHEPARIQVGITPAGAQHFKQRLLNESSGFREQLEDTEKTQKLFAEYGINVPAQFIVNGVTMPTQDELEDVRIEGRPFDSYLDSLLPSSAHLQHLCDRSEVRGLLIQARRTRWVFFYCDDYSFFNVERLLRGEIEEVPLRQLTAIAIVAGREVSISEADLELLLALSSEDWRDVDDASRLRELAGDGLVLLGDPDPELAALRELDERLGKNEWKRLCRPVSQPEPAPWH